VPLEFRNIQNGLCKVFGIGVVPAPLKKERGTGKRESPLSGRPHGPLAPRDHGGLWVHSVGVVVVAPRGRLPASRVPAAPRPSSDQARGRLEWTRKAV